MGGDGGRGWRCGRSRGRRKKLIERVAWDLSPAAPRAEQIIKAAIEAGDWQTVEDLTPPAIPEEAAFAYAAFNELASTRAVGMDVGPIPFTAIDAYAWRYGIADVDEFERFRVLIRTIEREQDRIKAETK